MLQGVNTAYDVKGCISNTACVIIVMHVVTWFYANNFFNSDTAGQSLRAGGATSLTENGVPPSIIQAIGRWASDAFKIYICKNPVLIQALPFGQTT